MKNKYRKLLALLPVMPLLMANSPLPEVFSDDYSDFSLSFIKEELKDDNYYYHYNLTNTGGGYISSVSLEGNAIVDGTREYYAMSYHAAHSSSVFENLVLPPEYNGEITMVSLKHIPDLSVLKSKAQGYSLFDHGIKINGTKTITAKEKDVSSTSNNYYYDIDLQLDIPSNADWNYGAILDITYKGEAYYLKIDERKDYLITTHEELDLSQLTVNNVAVIKSRPALYTAVNVFVVIAIVFVVGGILLVSFGVFAAIFFPAMARRRRRRRMQQNYEKV